MYTFFFIVDMLQLYKLDNPDIQPWKSQQVLQNSIESFKFNVKVQFDSLWFNYVAICFKRHKKNEIF